MTIKGLYGKQQAQPQYLLSAITKPALSQRPDDAVPSIQNDLISHVSTKLDKII